MAVDRLHIAAHLANTKDASNIKQAQTITRDTIDQFRSGTLEQGTITPGGDITLDTLARMLGAENKSTVSRALSDRPEGKTNRDFVTRAREVARLVGYTPSEDAITLSRMRRSMRVTRVTIKDVAAYAGVNKSTVSRVSRGKTDGYSPDVIRRVNDAIQTLQYVPTVRASRLGRRSHKHRK